jgi:hypothetical protein
MDLGAGCPRVGSVHAATGVRFDRRTLQPAHADHARLRFPLRVLSSIYLLVDQFSGQMFEAVWTDV